MALPGEKNDGASGGAAPGVATSAHDPATTAVTAIKDEVNKEFLRAENEDDDGYDPYSDRRPVSEPLFERDPWA